jgi:mRNA interferase MazF
VSVRAEPARPEYVPRRGDFLWLSFDPQAGHKQSGRRPALVLSPEQYNRRVGLALVCPITSQRIGYPFEVEIPAGSPALGVVLADQVRSLDWRARRADRAGAVPEATIEEAVRKLEALLQR